MLRPDAAHSLRYVGRGSVCGQLFAATHVPHSEPPAPLVRSHGGRQLHTQSGSTQMASAHESAHKQWVRSTPRATTVGPRVWQPTGLEPAIPALAGAEQQLAARTFSPTARSHRCHRQIRLGQPRKEPGHCPTGPARLALIDEDEYATRRDVASWQSDATDGVCLARCLGRCLGRLLPVGVRVG